MNLELFAGLSKDQILLNLANSLKLDANQIYTLLRLFHINLPSLIPVKGQLMKLTCMMFSIPKKIEGAEVCYFQNFIFTQTGHLF